MIQQLREQMVPGTNLYEERHQLPVEDLMGYINNEVHSLSQAILI